MSTSPDVTGALLAAAHDYANRGWRPIALHSVGPDGKTCSCRRGSNCTTPGKHPRDDEWQKKPALSHADIEALWEARPKGNVGIATGANSGFFVLDLDPKDDGIESFRQLLEEKGGGEWPLTYTVETGSGGYHYYLAMPDFDLRNSQGKLGKGIDIRAKGGQVVAPPSRTDKGVYTVKRDIPVAPAPDWLLDLLRLGAEKRADAVTAEDLPKPEDISPEDWARYNAYATRAIDAELARLDKLAVDGWDGEPWDATTFQVSCSLIEIANSPWNAYSLGGARNDVLSRAPRDNEGFDDWKVKQKFESALERVGSNARPLPATRPSAPAQDPLFSGPDVRRRTPDPSEGADPSEPGSAHPSDFFTEKGSKLLAAKLAKAVRDVGPIAWGRDEAFWSYEAGVWVPNREVVVTRCVDLLGDEFRKGHAEQAAIIAKRHAPRLSGDPVGQYMNFRNTMLDWQTGETVDHDPDFFSTIQFPINYDPEAQCPTFDRFLADVLHEDYVSLAWEMIGYLMMSGNPLQIAFMLYGSGGNGKGTLLRVLLHILGKNNVSSETLDRLNADRFSAVNLYGKIANIAGDIDATYQESTAAFKALTGEDEIPAERKFGDRFNFENWAVPLFSANKIPGSSDVTDGYTRRWIVLHFHRKVGSEKILGLDKILGSEAEGIAAKAIEPLRTLMRRRDFDPQGEAAKGKEEFVLAIDQVRQWVAHGGVQQAPEHDCPLTDLYAEYSIWAQRSGQGRLRESEFSHRLDAIGYPRVESAGVTYHTGLRARQQVGPSTSAFFG